VVVNSAGGHGIAGGFGAAAACFEPRDFLGALSIEVETVTKEKKWAWKKPGPRKILRFQQRHALENPMG
jgi:hypothetical protein